MAGACVEEQARWNLNVRERFNRCCGFLPDCRYCNPGIPVLVRQRPFGTDGWLLQISVGNSYGLMGGRCRSQQNDIGPSSSMDILTAQSLSRRVLSLHDVNTSGEFCQVRHFLRLQRDRYLYRCTIFDDVRRKIRRTSQVRVGYLTSRQARS